MTRHRRDEVSFLLALCLAVAAAFAPAAVAAHSDLVATEPADGAELAGSPGRIAIEFNRELNPDGSGITVSRADGERLSLPPAEVGFENPRSLFIELAEPLPPGTYVVEWRARDAADGHVGTGRFQFTVMAGATGTERAATRPADRGRSAGNEEAPPGDDGSGLGGEEAPAARSPVPVGVAVGVAALVAVGLALTRWRRR